MADKKKTRDDTEAQNKASDEAALKAVDEVEDRNNEVREALKSSNDAPRTTSDDS